MTLAEIIIALAVTGLAVLAGVGVQLFAMNAQNKAGLWSEAGMVAKSLMARSQDALQRDFSTSVAAPRGSVPPDLDPDGRFEYEVLESAEPPPLQDSLKRLEVVVYWRDRQGDQRYILTTKVAEP